MILILTTFLVVLLCVLRWQRRKKIQSCEQFRNDFVSFPFVGHAPLLLGNGEDKRKIFQAFGREALKQGGMTHLSCWGFNKFYTVIADPVVADLVMKNCLEKDGTMKLFGKFFRESLPVVPVSEWRPRRKFLNPAFGMKHLHQFFHIFEQKSSILVEKLEQNSGKGSFSFYNYISPYSFDVVTESTFGIESNSQNASKDPVLIALKNSGRLIAGRMAQPLIHNQYLYELTPMYTELKEISDTLWNFIDKSTTLMYNKLKKRLNDPMHKDICENNNETNNETTRKSILELLVEASNGQLSQELREETMIIIFAGADTSSVALSFTSLLLAKYPDVQEKVYQELQEIFGDSKRAIEYADLTKLKYTEAVLKETMRLYPPGLLLLRKVDKDLVLPSGQTLVKGTGAMINAWAIHRNPQYWGEDAEQFRPERFLEAPLKHPAAFMPFSYGPRNCIGYQFAMMSMKTTLAALVRYFRFLPADTQDISSSDKHSEIQTTFDILIRDVDNFAVRVRSRN